MKEVVAHVYDVTNSGSEKANNTILHINRFFKDGIGVGGIFHSAIEVPLFPCTPCSSPLKLFLDLSKILPFL
ncbi:hypothetical protein B296_00018784 [Ensete ventricosum]|uniref:PPPDE domain-containing protein n=1 Tax=Ensete ventricosum TaxID=4639 RepID=A0A426ZZ23_ENSVE|nr:hypothetical protein B296_00018784 [Ensete ventricosum]